MPRVITLVNPTTFKGYAVNDKYTYDKDQLNTIVEVLEYYHDLGQTDTLSNYQVFDITINVEDHSSLFIDMDDVMLDSSSLRFNPSKIKENVLTPDKYFFRWTREYKTEYGAGLHYHFMVIANNISRNKVMELHEQLEALDGVRSVYIANRPNAKTPFHNLKENGKDGLEDAILRHCYRAKLDQKLEGDRRSFDGSRKLKPLEPVSPRRLFS
jgi:hypothetical protein